MSKDETLFIPILLGTTREGRLSELAAQSVAEYLDGRDDVATEIVDPRDLKLPEDGKDFQDEHYEQTTKAADGFFIVTPEYNHSYPPSLKRMLDSENDFSHYMKKPVVIAGVSNGQWGGTRVIESLLPVLRAMDMYIARRDVRFANTNEIYDNDGNLTDDRVREEIQKAWDDLIFKARIMRALRE